MGQIHILDTPAGPFPRPRTRDQSHPEKSDLIPKSLSFRTLEIPVIVPPFGLEFPVNPVISGKFILPTRQGWFEAGLFSGKGLVDSNHHEQKDKKCYKGRVTRKILSKKMIDRFIRFFLFHVSHSLPPVLGNEPLVLLPGFRNPAPQDQSFFRLFLILQSEIRNRK